MTPSYERAAERLIRVLPRARRYCRFDPVKKRLLVGVQSLHRTTAARMYRTFWRIKLRMKP